MRGIERIISATVERGEALVEFGRRGGFTALVIAFAVGTAAWPIFHLDQVNRLGEDGLEWADRVALAVTTAVVFVLFLALFVGLVWWRRRLGRTSEETIGRVNDALLWTLGLPLLVFLSVTGVERDRPLFSLALIAGVALLAGASFYRLAAHQMVKLPRAYSEQMVRFGVWSIVVAMMAFFAIRISALAITQHWAMNTEIFGLGYYDNVLYNTLDGHVLSSTFLEQGVGNASHFEPILGLLIPFYALYGHPETLLVFQATWLALGAIPVFLIARSALDSRRAGLVFAAVYLLYPPLHGMALHEFHALTLLGPLVLWLMYCVGQRAWRAYYPVLGLCLLVGEDVALFMVGVAFSLVLSAPKTQRKHGWVTLLVAGAYFVLVGATITLSPDLLHCSGGACDPESGGGGFLLSVWSNPAYAVAQVVMEEKLIYLTQLLLPLLFLPLFARRGKVIFVFGLGFCLLATADAAFSIAFHYSSWLYPVGFALAPAALAHLRRTGRPWLRLDRTRVVPTALVMLMVVGVLDSWKFGVFSPNAAFRAGSAEVIRTLDDAHHARLGWLQAQLEAVPVDARLAVSRRVGPHAANRPKVFAYPGAEDAEVLIVMATDLDRETRDRFDADLKAGRYALIARRESLYVVRAPAPTTDKANQGAKPPARPDEAPGDGP